ncbi:MAG: peptidoglycan DD-metalloendopeptidase family protein [Clostridia bacterium]|nr:peptidoglycan DD-metalloendopeptidase family protein [Clostridia bacterium]
MRKVLCSILIIALMGYCINIYAQAEETIPTNTEEKKQLEELQIENEELQKQIEENINQLEVVQEELTQNLVQIQEIDGEIEKSEQSLSALNQEIEELDKKIRKTEKELKEKQKEYDEQKKLTDERMLAICENGELQYLDVLLGSRSVIDFISNYFLVSEIYEHDIQLLEKADAQKREIEAKSGELEKEKEILSEKKKLQQRDGQLLENTKTARQIQISKLSGEEQKIQTEIDEYKTQVTAIESEIRSLAIVEMFGEDYVGEEMIWPIPGYSRITSQFGMRTHPITGLYRLHTGTDVGAPIGANFIAMASGVVVKAEYNIAYGNMVIIDHGGGVQTLYAHGSEIIAKIGQTISQGDPVLKVGSTGYSTGPHAHFEIRINGNPVDPLNYVKAD